MSQLDQDAAIAANEQFEACLDMDKGLYVATCSAIRAYRQAECKPFKDAPRDGTSIQAWDTNTGWWRNIRFCEVGRNQYWGSVEQDDLVWGESKALSNFSHYRIPFNPKAPGD